MVATQCQKTGECETSRGLEPLLPAALFTTAWREGCARETTWGKTDLELPLLRDLLRIGLHRHLGEREAVTGMQVGGAEAATDPIDPAARLRVLEG